jgi:hypothetical protein
MSDANGFQTLADIVLSVHVGVVIFVVGGLVLIIAGNLLAWRWVNSPVFRIAHLGAIGYVVAETWIGIVCPLTTLEMGLRAKAGATTYAGSFIQHWLQRLLYYDAPPWVFIAAYSVFLLAVVAAWWYFPPHFKRRRSGVR